MSQTKWIKGTLSKLADNTKLSGVVDMPGGWDIIQKDADKLKQRIHMKFIKFNKTTLKVLYLAWENFQCQYKL